MARPPLAAIKGQILISLSWHSGNLVPLLGYLAQVKQEDDTYQYLLEEGRVFLFISWYITSI